MNSAGRILKLISFFKNNNVTLKILFNEKYSIDTTNIFDCLNFMIKINKEIKQLEKDLIKINKHNNGKYKDDLKRLYSMFSIRPIETNISNIINQTDLSMLIVRLEGLEDLLESSGIYENIIEEDKTIEIINIIDLLIKNIEDLETEEYLFIINILEEIKFTINTHKINGVKSIEEALEKLFCKSNFISNLITPELKNDLNKLIGNLYGIWDFAKKYGRTPIEYAKKQYDKKQSTEDIIDIEIEEKKNISE
jgi:hypothetical protein